MPSNITKTELRNVATAAARNAGGKWASLDYSGLTAAGVCLDYAADIASHTISGVSVLALDPANDDAGNAKATARRANLRRNVLSAMIRNAAKSLSDDNVDLRAYFADVDSKGTRGFIVERMK